ncbi:hypothetical protein BDW74DRAFT_151974, partial [Aspergillus multicolor]|uniref:uncharacterized protein n=1 Tax=Aspergillus multicolor TaxID=41759 RepID=UPI003CCD0D65
MGIKRTRNPRKRLACGCCTLFFPRWKPKPWVLRLGPCCLLSRRCLRPGCVGWAGRVGVELSYVSSEAGRRRDSGRVGCGILVGVLGGSPIGLGVAVKASRSDLLPVSHHRRACLGRGCGNERREGQKKLTLAWRTVRRWLSLLEL